MSDTPTQMGAVEPTEMLDTGIAEKVELAWSDSVDDESEPDDVHPHRWPMVTAGAALIVCAGVALVVSTYRAEDAPAAQSRPAPVAAPTPAPWRPPPMPRGSYKAIGVDGSSSWGNGATPRTLVAIDSSSVSYERYEAPDCTPARCTLVNTPITDADTETTATYHYADGAWREDGPGFYSDGGYKFQLDGDVVPDDRGGWRERNTETIVSCPSAGCGNLPIGATMSFEIQLIATTPAD